MPTTYAQNFEDLLLARCFAGKERGVYVDVGASSPIELSVTQLFYERGWSGLNIEPIPERVAEFRRLRPRDTTIRAIAGRERRTARLIRQPGIGAISTALAPGSESARQALAGAWQVEVREAPLSDLLAEAGVTAIDFLKIDVEGAEQAVLEGLDLARWRPAVLVLEATVPGTFSPSHQGWEPILLAARYRFAWFDGLNRFYVAEERAELAVQFSVPVFVGDGFRRFADMGSPLTNAAHPDHAFALNLARALLRVPGQESDDRVFDAITADLSPALLEQPVTAENLPKLHALAMGEPPPTGWAEAVLAERPVPTHGALLRRILRSDAFLVRRARVSLA